MSQDQAPQIRVMYRTPPGVLPMEKRGLGRKVWKGTTRFISFLGGLSRPVAEAWNLAGGPGGGGAIVVARTMQNFGHPRIQNFNRKVSMPRVTSSPYIDINALNQVSNNISTEQSASIEAQLASRYNTMEDVLNTRYDAITSSIIDIR